MPVGKTFHCESAFINSLTSTLATVTTLNTPSITLSNTYANMKALKYCNTTTGNLTGALTGTYMYFLSRIGNLCTLVLGGLLATATGTANIVLAVPDASSVVKYFYAYNSPNNNGTMLTILANITASYITVPINATSGVSYYTLPIT